MKKNLTSILLTFIFIGLFVPSESVSKNKNLIIATATTGGTYYPVGVAIGTLVSMKLAGQYGITATAINSAGSAENIQMMVNKEADLATLQALFGAMAYNGSGKYKEKPIKSLRSITTLWNNVEHFTLLSKHSKTGNINDLKNLHKKFSIGKRGSGTEMSGYVILKAVDIVPDKDIRLEYLGYQASANAMIDSRIIGANIPAGAPVAAISMLFAQMGKKVKILEFTDKQIGQINKSYPIWNRYTIKAGTYPKQSQDIHTIAQPNLLAVRGDIDKETVYLITKTIFENLSFLSNIHSATKYLDIDGAITNLPLPLHQGAIKYYREKGISIPAVLVKDE